MSRINSQAFKSARKARGFTQKMLAAALDVEQPTVQRWEAGTREPDTFEKFVELCDKLDVSADALLGRRGFVGASHTHELDDDAVIAVLEAAVRGGWQGQAEEAVLQAVSHAIGGGLRSFLKEPQRLANEAARSTVLGIVTDSVSQTMKKLCPSKANTRRRMADNFSNKT